MKFQFKIFVCIVFVFFLVLPAFSENNQDCIKLIDLIKIARINSPILQMAETDIIAAEGLFDQAKSEFSPTMRFAFAYKDWDQKRTGHMGGIPGATQFYSDRLTESSLQIRQLLFETGSARNQILAARLRAEGLRENKLRIEQELFFNIFNLGITSISQAAKIEAIRKNIEDVEAALASVKKLQEVGKAAGVDVLRIEFRREESLAQLDEAFHQQNSILSKITRLAGLATMPVAIAEDELNYSSDKNKISLPELEISAIEHRPDLQALELELKASGYDVIAAKKILQPQLNLIATLNRYGDKTGWGIANGFAGVEIAWPILDGGLSRGKIKVTKAVQNKTAARLNDMILNIKDQVRVAFSAVETGKTKIERSRKGLSLAEEAYRIELLTYEAGKGTINDLLDAQSEVFSTRARLIQDKNDLIVANLSLSLAIGKFEAENY